MEGKTGGKTRLLIFMAIIILGLYGIPNAVAKYAGSHTWERNATFSFKGAEANNGWRVDGQCYCHEISGAKTIDCLKCHDYILEEANATALSRYVLDKHTAPYNPFAPGAGESSPLYACLMCHRPPYANVQGGHTGVTVVVCTYCHGNSTTPGIMKDHSTYAAAAPNLTRTSYIGTNLTLDADAHSNFFNPLENMTSEYFFNGTQEKFSAGFYACMACHTHVGLDINITRPDKFSLKLNLTSVTKGFNLTDLDVNTTSRTTVTGGKEPGSVWK